MPDPRDAVALSYLKDVMRSRTPDYIPDGSVDVGGAPHGAATGQPPAEPVEKIDRILSEAIPASPAYNKQRLYALNTILKEKLHGMDKHADAQVIDKILDDIDDHAPQFKKVADPEIIARLYDKLEEYSKITGGNPAEFPYIEVIGHRKDEPTIKMYDSGISYGTIRNSEYQKENLKEINSILDEIVPDGAYFNKLRQSVIDSTIAHGEGIAGWVKKEEDIAAGRKRTGDTGFIANSKYFQKERAMGALGREIDSWRRKLEPPKRLEPANAISIGQSMREHIEAVEAAEGRPAKRRRGADGRAIDDGAARVPEDIKRGVRRTALIPTRTNQIAKAMASRVIASLDAIAAPRRGNFESRVRLVERVHDCKDYWLNPESVDIAGSPSLYSISISHSDAFKNKEVEFKELARNVRDYNLAWKGILREIPPASSIVPRQKAPASKSTPKSRGAAALEKAAAKRGQQKLTFGTRLGQRVSNTNQEGVGQRAGSSLVEKSHDLEERERDPSRSR